MNIAVTRNPNQTPVKQPVPSFEDYTQKALSGREKKPESTQKATLAPPNYTEMFGFDGQTAILRNTDIDGDGIAEDIYIYVQQKKETIKREETTCTYYSLTPSASYFSSKDKKWVQFDLQNQKYGVPSFKWGFETDWPVNGTMDGKKDFVGIEIRNVEKYEDGSVCGHFDDNKNPYNTLSLYPQIRQETLTSLAGEKPLPPKQPRPGAITGEIKLSPAEINQRNQLVKAWEKYGEDLTAYNIKVMSVDLTNDGQNEPLGKIDSKGIPSLRLETPETREQTDYFSFYPYTFAFKSQENKFTQVGLKLPVNINVRNCYELASN